MRLDLELPSEIHVQRSSASLNKDHNNFVYEEDVLNPLTIFLNSNVSRGRVLTIQESSLAEALKTPELFKEEQDKSNDFVEKVLWCICPFIALAECCFSSCYLSTQFVGTKTGLIRRDYRYISRMERGKANFPIELFPSSNKRGSARTANVTDFVENPLSKSYSSSSYDREIIITSRRRVIDEEGVDSSTVRNQMDEFPIRKKANSKADEL